MKAIALTAVMFLMAGIALAKDPPVYQKGAILQMESSSCGYNTKGGKSVAGELLGTDSENKKTKELLCQEYVLQTDRLIYRIRPRDDNHPVLLRSEEHTSELQSRLHLVCRLLLEKKKNTSLTSLMNVT